MERCTLFYNGEAFTSATLSSTTAITTLTKYTILNPKSTISSTSTFITLALTAFTLFSFAAEHSAYCTVAIQCSHCVLLPMQSPPSKSFTKCEITPAFPIITFSSSLFCDN